MSGKNLNVCIDEFFDDLVLFDDYTNNHKYKGILKASIELFLDKKNTYSAMKVYEMFFMIYQINSNDRASGEITILNEANIPLDFIKLMGRYAEMYDLNFPVRSVEVFVMGLAVYSQNKTYRKAFRQYVEQSPYSEYYRIDGEFSHEEFLYRWAIAALFYDAAMPFEFMTGYLKDKLNLDFNLIMSGYGEDFSVDFSSIRKLDSLASNPYFKEAYLTYYPKAKFLDLSKPTRIMVHKISLDFGLGLKGQNLLIDLIDNHMYGDCPDSQNDAIDHGLLSAIILLNFYGYLINRHAEDYAVFYFPIVDSASAILLHNFYRNVLIKKPFDLAVMHVRDCPLAYLLALCDGLEMNGSFDWKVKVDDYSLEISYAIDEAASAHEDYLESYLAELLDLKSVFRKGVHFESELKSDGEISFKSRIRQKNIPIGDIEHLAIRIHEFEDRRGLHPQAFKDLSPDDKMSAIKHARSIYRILNMIGCEVADAGDERSEYTLSESEIKNLAEYSSELRQEEKSASGKLGYASVDFDSLTGALLAPTSKVGQTIFDSEVRQIQNHIGLLNECGLKIVLSKISLLARELYGGSDMFFSNALIENLLEELSYQGYELVDAANHKEAVDSFDRYDAEYFAKKDHDAWCSLKFALGWRHGRSRDDERKTSPNLISWDLLDNEFKQWNVRKFEELPKSCGNVGLKIVKVD